MATPLAGVLAACALAAAPALAANVPEASGRPVEPPAREVYADPALALEPGSQSTLDPREAAAVLREAGVTGRDGLADAARVHKWLVENFKSFNGGGGRIAKVTAESLLRSRELSGCHDWGLLKSALLRAAGYPARMVDTAGTRWMSRTRAGRRPHVYSGHVFVEAYIDGRWTLLDSVSPRYIKDYDPSNGFIPMRVLDPSYVAMFKGADPAGYGIRSNEDLTRGMERIAKEVDPSALSAPGESVAELPDVGPALPYFDEEALSAPWPDDPSRLGTVVQLKKAGLDVNLVKSDGRYWAHLYRYGRVFAQPVGDASFSTLEELRGYVKGLAAGG